MDQFVSNLRADGANLEVSQTLLCGANIESQPSMVLRSSTSSSRLCEYNHPTEVSIAQNELSVTDHGDINSLIEIVSVPERTPDVSVKIEQVEWDQNDNYRSSSLLNADVSNCKTYVCDVCHKDFRTLGGFNRHMVVHKSRERFSCKECSQTFGYKCSLEKHVLTKHRNLKNYMCYQCDKMFTQQHTLADHIKTHYGERNHKCTVCDKSFAQAANLRNHVSRKHNKCKVIECDQCDRKFSTNYELHRHQASHEGIKDFSCRSCKKTYTRKENLLKHIAKEHRDDTS